MKKILNLGLLLLFTFLLSFSNGISQVDFRTGLILESEEEYEQIPDSKIEFLGVFQESIDLTENMPPPGNQGAQNSCVAWAVAYCVKSYHENLNNQESFFRNNNSLNYSIIFSPSFVYNQINNGVDSGSTYYNALNLLDTIGVVSWFDFPYNEDDYLTQPADELIERAEEYGIESHNKIPVISNDALKTHLNQGIPIMITVVVDSAMMLYRKSDKPNIWDSYEGRIDGGYHALVIVGYDDELHAYKIFNSWGTDWGDGGFFWINYDFINDCIYRAYIIKNE